MTDLLPEGWKQDRLDVLAELERAAVVPQDIQEGTKYVGLEHIESSGEFHNIPEVSAGELASNKFAFSKQHVLYGKLRPYLTKIARPDFSGVCSTEIIPIRTNGRLNRNYLYHYLRQPRMVALANTRTAGANLPRLSPTDLASFPITYPESPTEQRRIADILDEVDSLRRKRSEAVWLALDLVMSLFHEVFGEKLVDPKQQTPLDEVAEIGSGIMKGRKFNGQVTVELPYLRVANVQAGYLDLSEMKSITVPLNEVEKYRLKYHDIVLTEGGDHDKLGRGALWESQIQDCVHQNHIFRVRCNQKRLLPLYFATYLQSQPAIAYFLRCAKKTTNLATINMTQLRELPVHLPTPARQQVFADRLVEVRRMTVTQEDSRSELDNLFHSLLQRAFRGEL